MLKIILYESLFIKWYIRSWQMKVHLNDFLQSYMLFEVWFRVNVIFVMELNYALGSLSYFRLLQIFGIDSYKKS